MWQPVAVTEASMSHAMSPAPAMTTGGGGRVVVIVASVGSGLASARAVLAGSVATGPISGTCGGRITRHRVVVDDHLRAPGNRGEQGGHADCDRDFQSSRAYGPPPLGWAA
jgi:hypothetical protein